jgi:hypothetical protein
MSMPIFRLMISVANFSEQNFQQTPDPFIHPWAVMHAHSTRSKIKESDLGIPWASVCGDARQRRCGEVRGGRAEGDEASCCDGGRRGELLRRRVMGRGAATEGDEARCCGGGRRGEVRNGARERGRQGRGGGRGEGRTCGGGRRQRRQQVADRRRQGIEMRWGIFGRFGCGERRPHDLSRGTRTTAFCRKRRR